MKRIPAAIFLSSMLLLAGCSNKSKEQSSSVVTDTTDAMTEITSDQPAPPEITTAATLLTETDTTVAESETTAAVTESTSANEPGSTAAPLITTLAPVTTQMMGGQGGLFGNPAVSRKLYKSRSTSKVFKKSTSF